jgi:4-hydroxybenzoate polyprenyltransferase
MDWISIVLVLMAIGAAVAEGCVLFMWLRMKTMKQSEALKLTLVCLGFVIVSMVCLIRHQLVPMIYGLPLLVIAYWQVYGVYLKREIPKRTNKELLNRLSQPPEP